MLTSTIDACAVVVPVKAFTAAKARLAPVLDEGARAALARRLATIVVAAAAPMPVLVVCDDEEVASWAAGLGTGVVWAPGRGLDGAVADGVLRAGRDGAPRAIVAHADLPLARDLAPVARTDADVVLVPDRHRDGTNVALVPTGGGFRFAYGAGSFERHADEARRLGLVLEVRDDPALAWDVDVPADLAHEAVRGLLGARDRPPATCT